MRRNALPQRIPHIVLVFGVAGLASVVFSDSLVVWYGENCRYQHDPCLMGAARPARPVLRRGFFFLNCAGAAATAEAPWSSTKGSGEGISRECPPAPAARHL